MMFTRVLNTNVVDGSSNVIITLVGQDQQPYELTLTESAALQVMLALRSAATRLKHSNDLEQVMKAFALDSCSPMEAISLDGASPGLMLKTKEGFRIPLLLTNKTRVALRACISLSAGGTNQ